MRFQLHSLGLGGVSDHGGFSQSAEDRDRGGGPWGPESSAREKSRLGTLQRPCGGGGGGGVDLP